MAEVITHYVLYANFRKTKQLMFTLMQNTAHGSQYVHTKTSVLCHASPSTANLLFISLLSSGMRVRMRGKCV